VDAAIPQTDMDKFKIWEKLRFDVMFVGDDWFKSDKWRTFEKKFNKVGVRIVYFPYTPGTSSTLINETLRKLRHGG
jgi:glycerol-3-phosphate cytidylyltransferase